MKEIERRFLVTKPFPEGLVSKFILQGYVTIESPIVRIRVIDGLGGGEGHGVLTIKYKTDEKGVRDEYEDLFNYEQALELYGRCKYTVQKTRYFIPAGAGLTWEVDKYWGTNAGLVVAEIEVPKLDHPLPPLPTWIGEEITGKKKYGNLYLAGVRK